MFKYGRRDGLRVQRRQEGAVAPRVVLWPQRVQEGDDVRSDNRWARLYAVRELHKRCTEQCSSSYKAWADLIDRES